MLIRCAEEKDFRELRQFYDRMCEVLEKKDFLPEGDKGGFPSDEMVKNAIAEKDQFIGIEDGQIVAAYIMNHDCDEAYHTVRWLTDAEDKEMVVLHAFASASRIWRSRVFQAIGAARNRYRKRKRAEIHSP